MEELDKYLSGQMSDEERPAFEKRLAEQPDLQAALLVREGLQQWRIERSVAAAAQLRKGYERRARRQRRVWSGLAAACVLGALAWWYFPKSTNSALPPSPPVELPADSIAPQPPAPPSPSSGPVIAERQASPGSFSPAPNVRGSEHEAAASQALLDQLWYGAYPPASWQPDEELAPADTLLRQRSFAQAYVRLQRLEMRRPDNDTLRLMKGYCLLEMREGAEALRYLENLEARQPEWKAYLQWHRGLARLLNGEQAAAVQEFRVIAAQAGHPFAAQARKALGVLEKRK
ncbi:MAG: hypothetical protein IAE84_00960 [Saprospiraceae bacterium]|nr:hypothetical protein [Saprospiraceae bacterium]